MKPEHKKRIHDPEFERKPMTAALLCGMAGCLCFGAGDWLMLWGDPAYLGSLRWLTEGAAEIAPWRNGLAMALAFPGILLYATALFSIEKFLHREKHRRIYCCLTAAGLLPWLCLHLFYIMILYLFAWLRQNGWEQAAFPAAQALYGHLSWVVPLSEALMLPPYGYWFWAVASDKTYLPRKLAAANPLLLFMALRLLTVCLPQSSFQIAFTNGLMSESMLLWFAALLIWAQNRKRCTSQVDR
ncbi:MAG: hypothetical protein Q4F81_10310 [Eubacteriales bacterium]|nr:hypothetical protein [Eubacteriales bacterium]